MSEKLDVQSSDTQSQLLQDLHRLKNQLSATHIVVTLEEWKLLYTEVTKLELLSVRQVQD